MEYKISVPASEQELKKLKAGDSVLLSGTVYTARDAAHKRICECLDRGERPPFDLNGSAVYYVGPTPEHDGCCIGSAGPTTSGRMDTYSPRLLDAGLKIMIGKGNRSDEVVRSMIRNGAVYLAAIGGAGALMAASIEEAELVCWEDLGCEAVRRLTVKDMPLTVAIDSEGNDLYRLGRAQYLKEVKE
ncbi:MAG: Fe-S-containing hydro-lyase [Clostridiales bacterium]|nr:Fe-S-containing hydro-lyase [Clostridiales bacterium]